jgi:VanZ family protein
LPGKDLPEFQVSDKRLHLVGFAGLATLFWMSLWTYGHPWRKRIWLCLIILPIYGALDEMTQPAFHRTASVLDWLYDVIGIVLATTTWELLAWRFRPKRKT